MTDHHHPFRDAELHVFMRCNANGKGASYLARFFPYDTYPVLFFAASQDGAIAKAEQFRGDTVAKHENAFTARQEAAAKARATKAAKKEAAE